MASINDTPVWVDGTLTAGNMLAGRVYCPPGADSDNNQTASVTANLTGTGNLFVQVTGHSDLPVCRTHASNASGVRMVSINEVTTNTFKVLVHRADAATNGTYVFYFVTRNP